jgi:hypothetical protein
MPSERITQAMDRIDRALSRIETQAALSRHSVNASPDNDDARDSELVQRHEALREQVESSLAELDTLIESLER